MKDMVLARRYAKALFEIASEEKNVLLYRSGLTNFNKVFSVQPDLLSLLSNWDLDVQKRKAIVEWIGKRYSFPKALLHFFFLLLERGRMSLFPSIFRAYETMANARENTVVAQVMTANVEAAEKCLGELSGVLEKITGKKVLCEVEEDSSLIAGLQIRIEDTIYDGSVRAKLDHLKETLMS